MGPTARAGRRGPRILEAFQEGRKRYPHAKRFSIAYSGDRAVARPIRFTPRVELEQQRLSRRLREIRAEDEHHLGRRLREINRNL